MSKLREVASGGWRPLPRDHGRLSAMDSSYSYLRQFTPDVLSAIDFQGGPGTSGLMEAVAVLTELKPPWTAAARSALERFLQLAGDFVGRGLHGALHDFGGLGQRPIDSLFDGRLAKSAGERKAPLVSGPVA